MIEFNQEYYEKIMKEFEYNPFDFEKINFSLGDLSKDDLQMRWLCHHHGDIFAQGIMDGEKAIVSTGIGLTGIPHIGTLSQILRAIALQKAGIPVNMVLGDLDAYNGKSVPLIKTRNFAKKYKKFIKNLGFKEEGGSILRSQYDTLKVLRTLYLIGFHRCSVKYDST